MDAKHAGLEARDALASGASLKRVMELLRRRSLTKVQTMIVLEDDLGLAHRDAKLAVHRSEAWKTHREAAEVIETELLDSGEN